VGILKPKRGYVCFCLLQATTQKGEKMERKSSIHFESAQLSAKTHNTRIYEPSYLITESNVDNIDYQCDIARTKEQIIDDYENYQRIDKKGIARQQRWQKNAQPVVEAVLNTKAKTTMEDLIKVKDMLSTYGYEVKHISNHKDEGHIIITDEKTGYEHTISREHNKDFKSKKCGSIQEYKYIDEE